MEEFGKQGYYKRNILVQHGNEFEKLVSDIFMSLGWSSHIYERLTNTQVDEWDVICESGSSKCYIEVKAYRKKYMEIGLLRDIIFRINKRNIEDESTMKVLVVASVIRKESLAKVNTCDSIIILDISNLLFLVQDNEQLKNRLMAFIEYTVDDIQFSIPDERILISPKYEEVSRIDNIKNFISQIESWNCVKSTSAEYEKLCSNVLKKLFIKDLSVWEEQKKSNEDLYRFDLICKIKDDNVSPFWKFIEDFFNSKYIVFEFKNYSKPITQKEIYTTEKYLYAKALRSVAIIISANGCDRNSYKATKGILREEGKLVILLSNKDMINMLLKIENQEEPSDYIYDKLDQMLIELEK